MRNWKIWLGIVISGFFLLLSFRKIDFGELWSALGGADYLQLLPVVLLTILTFWVRAFRWKYLLESVKRIGTPALFSATMIGFAANNLLPARLGEPIRAYAIARKEDISWSTSFASIVVERILDGLTLLFFLTTIFFFFPFPPWVKKAGAGAFGIYASLLLFLVILRIKTERILGMVNWILRPLPQRISARTGGLLRSFVDGLRILSRGRLILIASILSLLLWALVAITIHWVFIAFHLDLPPHASFVLLTILSLGLMLPSSPGFLGTFQYFCIVSLTLFNISKGIALSFSIVYHASQFIPVTLVGLLYFWRENLSLRGAFERQPRDIA